MIRSLRSLETHSSFLISSELKSFRVRQLRPFKFTEPRQAAPALEKQQIYLIFYHPHPTFTALLPHSDLSYPKARAEQLCRDWKYLESGLFAADSLRGMVAHGKCSGSAMLCGYFIREEQLLYASCVSGVLPKVVTPGKNCFPIYESAQRRRSHLPSSVSVCYLSLICSHCNKAL